MGIAEVFLLVLVLALGVLLDSTLGRSSSDFLPYLHFGNQESPRETLPRFEALCGTGSLLLLAVGMSYLPADVFFGTLLSLCGACLGWLALRIHKRMRL